MLIQDNQINQMVQLAMAQQQPPSQEDQMRMWNQLVGNSENMVI